MSGDYVDFTGTLTPAEILNKKLSGLQTDIDRVSTGQDQFLKTLNVAMTGTTSLTGTGSPTGAVPITTTITHNLGYVPSFLGFIDDSTNRFNVPHLNFNVVTGALRSHIHGYSTSSILLFLLDDFNGSISTYQIRYYIFKEVGS